MDEKQQKTVQQFAEHIKHTNPQAIGVAYLVLGCGCLQGAPFDENGDQAGPIEHFLTQSNGDSIKICPECANDGGPPEESPARSSSFDPDNLATAKRHWICRRSVRDSHRGLTCYRRRR